MDLLAWMSKDWTANNSVLIQDVAWMTCQEWWIIETGGKRGSGKSMLAASHDADDDISFARESKNEHNHTTGVWTSLVIIIMSCLQHGYPWPSLATSPYHSSPPAGLQSYILCPHIVAVCKFELVVLLLHGHMWGSMLLYSTLATMTWGLPIFTMKSESSTLVIMPSGLTILIKMSQSSTLTLCLGDLSSLLWCHCPANYHYAMTTPNP